MTFLRGLSEAKYLPRVFARVKPFSGLAVGSVTVLIGSAAMRLLTPWPLLILVDCVLQNRPLPPMVARLFGGVAPDPHTLLVAVVLGGLAITVVENVLLVANNYLGTRLKEQLVLNFRGELFQHAQRLSFAFHDHQRTGDLMNRITYQATTLGSVVMAAPPFIQSLVTLVGMFWIAQRIDPMLALISLSVVPFIYYSVGFYATHVDSRMREVKGLEGQTLSIVHEAMAMLRVIVAFGREHHEYSRFRRQGETAVDARVKLTVQQTVFSLVVNTITATGTALVLGFGAHQVLQGRLTVGELLVVLSYIASVYTPLEAISNTVGTLKDHLIGVQMAFDLLDTNPEVEDAPDAVTVGEVLGRVTFERVSFAYQDRRDTLSDIALDAMPGQLIAIVGATGAGKTTLAGLLPRFYDPSRGRILIDGRDIRSIRLASLRNHISVVHQDPLLFCSSIADNIRYGRLDASDEEVESAAEAAYAHDFIARLPKQYQTTIGERGVQLSGGERQRLALARAFLKNAPILILDEPTASIDSRTEGIILDALDRLVVGRTTFLIAHRLSTVRHADQILVMDHGRIVERGTHESLVEREGVYKRLCDAQAHRSRPRRWPGTPVRLAGSIS